jgi:hypothetical protein
MKSFAKFPLVCLLFLFAYTSYGQDEKKSVTEPVQSGSKAQDHNSSRSNKTSSVAAPELNTPVAGQNNQVIKPDADQSANSKKGYDYYKSKSDLNAAGIQNNPSSTSISTGINPQQEANKKDESGTENKAFNQNSARSNNPQPKK